MKAFHLLFFTAIIWASCQDQPAPEPKTEAPATEQKPDLSDVSQMKEAAKQSGGDISESSLVGVSKGTITGKNVPVRNAAGSKSEKVGTFRENEKVQIIKFEVIQTEGEGYLAKPLVLKKKGSSITLQKGQTVLIEGANDAGNTFYISYEDPKKGRFESEAKADAFQGRMFANWYHVKRENGETGWVMGNFVKLDSHGATN